MLNSDADLCNRFLETRQLRRQTCSHLVRCEIVLGLVFRSIKIVADSFQLFEGNIDCAVLTPWKEQGRLPLFQIPLDGGPPRRADAQTGSRYMRGDLTLLKRVELLQFLQSECKHIVVESLGRTTQEAFQRGLVAGRVT